MDLATIAADRAQRAAEDADDPLRIAAAQWNLGHVLVTVTALHPDRGLLDAAQADFG
ncbi:hypothetical protein AB0A81_21250 [Streptomyces flaveolus]|uniref:Uncharacterized protein n=1 Tax=Streptomyces flaveolus TaxID=67297 RepID=A0ABV1VEX9_9ACTN